MKRVTFTLSDFDMSLLEAALLEKAWQAKQQKLNKAADNYDAVLKTIKQAYRNGERIA